VRKATKVSVRLPDGTLSSSTKAGTGSPWPLPDRYWPRTTSRPTLSGVKALSERSTFSFSSRIASALLRDGGSIATIVSSCRAWFWIMSRSAPVRL
jgi:hypothetical protein